MEIIVLIPGLICLVALLRQKPSQVFLRVYLPFFLLFPGYYYWKVAALPPITVAQSVLIPLGIAIALRQLRSWRLTTMDLWVALFMVSTCVADNLADRSTASIFSLYSNLVEGLVPYMIGKTLIEQSNLRMETVRRIVVLLAVCGVISFYEYKMQFNPFTLVWSRFFPGETFAWKTQIRWGFGRISGPFGQSELAGMVFLFGSMMALWLGYANQKTEKFKWFPRHPFKKSTILSAVLVLSLLATQARGPWLGFLISIPIAYVGRTKRVIRNGLITMAILLPLLAIGYVGFKHYASVATPSSAEQETAQYRNALLTNYIPVAIKGGAWGWGSKFPRVNGQDSIDNEYLLIALTQGYVGLIALCLIALESVIRLTFAGIHSNSPQDRSFSFSLLGVFCGLLITIFTVFLGNQPYQLFFLLAGWSQVLNRKDKQDDDLPKFEHVYT